MPTETERLILRNQAAIMTALYSLVKLSPEKEILLKQGNITGAALRYKDIDAFLEKGIDDEFDLLKIRLAP